MYVPVPGFEPMATVTDKSISFISFTKFSLRGLLVYVSLTIYLALEWEKLQTRLVALNPAEKREYNDPYFTMSI